MSAAPNGRGSAVGSTAATPRVTATDGAVSVDDVPPQPASAAAAQTAASTPVEVLIPRPMLVGRRTAVTGSNEDTGSGATPLTVHESAVDRYGPEYGGDFMLDSQGDQELIFDHFPGGHQSLTALHLPASVDDSAWATTRHGALYVTDNTDDTVDVVSDTFTVGTMYSSVTPCDSNSAPATCPAPGFPPNYLASTNMLTRGLTPVPLTGPVLRTEGVIFIP